MHMSLDAGQLLRQFAIINTHFIAENKRFIQEI